MRYHWIRWHWRWLVFPHVRQSELRLGLERSRSKCLRDLITSNYWMTRFLRSVGFLKEWCCGKLFTPLVVCLCFHFEHCSIPVGIPKTFDNGRGLATSSMSQTLRWRLSQFRFFYIWNVLLHRRQQVSAPAGLPSGCMKGQPFTASRSPLQPQR